MSRSVQRRGLTPFWGAMMLSLVALWPLPVLAQDDDCSECHAVEADAVPAELQVDASLWTATVHGEAGIDCSSCHADSAGEIHVAFNPWDACGDCHEDAVDAIEASIHGKIRKTLGAPNITCGSCHGSVHALLRAENPDSAVAPINLAEVCGACHANPDFARRGGIRLVQPLAAYQASVHARALARGEHAATCSDCHGSHDIQRASNRFAPVHRSNIPETCGQCHNEIAEEYQASVHGIAASAGVSESPICTDCHGEHRIIEPARSDSPVFASNVPLMTCGRCHGDIRLSEKFGMLEEQVDAYQDSFHGLAARSGAPSVASCASCHGIHDILPSSDPRSHVNKANLSETCGTCHPGAGSRFAIGAVHVLSNEEDTTHWSVYWARIAYLWLIWMTIGGMLIHNALDLRRKALSPMPRPVVPISERRERFPVGFRIAHAMLFTSFFVLVVSGFALKYPEAGWARVLLSFESTIPLRQWLHRIAAIVMLGAFGFHFVHLAVDRRARRCMAGMIPSLHDVTELKEKLEWYVGRRPTMPTSPHLNYAEKAEYLALVWGTLVMAVTGFVLWFESWSLIYLPKWVSDLATVIHFYEAILASLAILVWHFYFVLLDPLVYPMDTAWLTGKEVPGRTLERDLAMPEDPAPEAEGEKDELRDENP